VVLGETSSPASSTGKSKNSSSHRKSSNHTPVAVTPSSGHNSGGASKPSTATTQVDQTGAGAGTAKGKNVCVVEPQSMSKAMAVVAPLMAESPQFTKVFGAPIVKPDAAKKHHHQKVLFTNCLFFLSLIFAKYVSH